MNILAFEPHWLSLKGAIGGTILGAFRTLLFSLDTIIYKLIIQFYNMFNVLCKSRLLENEVIGKISQRIGLLLGLIMFLNVCFSFIQIVLEPDKLTDKEVGAVALIKKSLIVIILLGSSSWIFAILFDLQKNVVESNIISKLLMPYEVKINDEDASKKFGEVLSIELLTAFYEIPETNDEQEIEYADDGSKTDAENCKAILEAMKNKIYSEGKFDLGYICLNQSVVETTGLSINNADKKEKFLVEFNGPLSIIVGIVAAFLILSYCTKLAIRMLQIAVLEVISPLAFISYLSPAKKDGMLSKWWKLYFATYIDVFIRIAIINFGVFIIEAIFATQTSGVTNFWNSTDMDGLGGATRLLLKVIMILAILAFMRKAPETLKELLPSSGSGLGFGASLKEMGEYFSPAGRVVGAGASALVSGGASFADRYRMARDSLGKKKSEAFLSGLSGLGSGIGRGLITGAQKGNIISNFQKAFNAQHEADVKYEDLIASGGTGRGAIKSAIIARIGGETLGQLDQRRIANLDRMDDFKKQMYAAADEISFVKSAKDTWEQMHQNVGENDIAFEKRKQRAYERYKQLRNTACEMAEQGFKVDQTKEVTIKDKDGSIISKEVVSFDEDGHRYATDITSIETQANAFATSHKVERYNLEKKRWEQIEGINNRKDLADASDQAHETKTYITRQKEYSAHQAEDKAAGVDKNSSGSTKK